MLQKVYFATDHAGFELKEKLVPFVRDVLGYEVEDFGAYIKNSDDDFTDYIAKASREVSLRPKETKAVILGGSGQGEAMLANRFTGVRAVVYYGGTEEILTLSRVHNDANVLSLGARFLSVEQAKKAVMLWLNTAHEPVVKYDRRIAQTDSFVQKRVVLRDAPTSRIKREESVTIVPSLPARSFSDLQILSQKLKGHARELQVDIVDGVFAPNLSWPFTEPHPKEELLKLRTLPQSMAIEVDCMCSTPEEYLDIFVELGVSRVIIHAGSTLEYDVCIAHARNNGYKIGLAILNTTNAELFDAYATHFDFVQVMGIEKVGAQGQPFDERTLSTVKTLRTKYPNLEIAVDGAVNESTILKLKEAGANRFAPGSAVAKASDPKAAYDTLAKLVGL